MILTILLASIAFISWCMYTAGEDDGEGPGQ